jgi:hypothetical protein
MEQELFDHRFGARPLLVRILGSVSVVSKDKIPFDGYREKTSCASNVAADAAVVETEALLLDTQAVNLLDSIHAISPTFGAPSAARNNNKLNGEIRATWNKRTRSGVCLIRLLTHGWHALVPNAHFRFTTQTLLVRLFICDISKQACPL